MTKTNAHRNNPLGEHLDLYKHAIIWDTRLGSTLDDYDESLGPEENEFRRELRDSIRKSVKQAGKSEPLNDCSNNNPTIEDAEEISRVWHYFSRHTTFHGVKNIPSEERRRPSRLFWLLLVLGMAGGLIYTVASLMIEYYEYNTVTRSEVKVSSTALFPSVTFCSNCPFKNKDKLQNTTVFKFVAQSAVLELGRLFPVNYSDPELMSLLSLTTTQAQEEFSDTAREMFFVAQYEGKLLNISEEFEILETDSGRCFTFNGPKNIAKNGPRLVSEDGRNSGLRVYIGLNQDTYFIYDDITAGVRVYLSHHPETPRLSKDGIDLHPGTSTRLALNPIQYTFLPAPYKSYGEEACENMPADDLKKKMINSTFYSYENCLEQCQHYKAAQECGCYSNLLYVDGYPECTLGDMSSCFIATKRNITSKDCNCPRPCTFTRYDTTMSASQLPSRVSAEILTAVTGMNSPAALREEFLEVRIYMETMLVRHERHEPQYTFNSIFAFLGGQMGFFMGASLITMAELIETFVFSGFVFIHKKLMRMGRMVTGSTGPQVRPIKQAW